MGFTRQEYWSGLPFPSPADLPDPGIKPASPAWAGRFFTSELPGKSLKMGGGVVVISTEMSSATQWATEANSQDFFQVVEPFQQPGNIPEELQRVLESRTYEFAHQHSLSWKNSYFPSATVGHKLN